MPSYVRAGIRKCARIRALSSCLLSLLISCRLGIGVVNVFLFPESLRLQLVGKELFCSLRI